jgi:adenylate cyclase
MKETLGTFGRYVPRELVRRILASGLAPEIGGRRQEITLLFTDIERFSALAETIDPEELMLRTSRYFNEVSRAISAHSGVIDKYIGDAVMALWNAPMDDADHVTHACRAALACRSNLQAFNRTLADQGLPPINTRIGVHTGEAIVGNVGSDERINYTAVGANVNLASRIEGLNKVYGTQILVSEAVVERIGGRFTLRYVDLVKPVGSGIPIRVYELLGEEPAAGALRLQLENWDAAIALWHQNRWQEARAAFLAIAGGRADSLADLYAERCRAFLETPPAAQWDGVTVSLQK